MTTLKQSTQVVVRIGPFVDVTNGFTPETEITLGAADEAEALKAAGAATADISAATWAAISGADGWYDLTLTTAHTDTVGDLTIIVHDDSVCLPVFARFQVVEEDTYDYLYASGSAPDTQIAAIKAETALIVADTAELQGDDVPGLIAALDTVVDRVETDTQDLQTQIGTAGAGLIDLGGMSTGMKAEVESEANDALVAIHLDHLLAVDYDPASKPGTATALLNELVESDAGVSRYTVNALENGPSGSGASAAAIADAVWDEDQVDHTGAGTFGVIATEIAAIPTTAMRGTDGANTTTPPTVAAIADGIWDEVISTSAHNDAQSAGKRLRQTSSQVAAEAAVNDAGASTTVFITDLTEASDEHYADQNMYFTTGALTGQARIILSYNGTTKTITLDEALTEAPANGDEFIIHTEHVHPVSQIADGVWDEPRSGHATAGTYGEPFSLQLSGTCASSLTTTTFVSDLAVSVNDQYVGRTIMFKNDTATAALQGQTTDITGNTASSDLFTFTALTTAPGATDTFQII